MDPSRAVKTAGADNLSQLQLVIRANAMGARRKRETKLTEMVVELEILSGSRFGEKLRFERDSVTVGAQADCDLCFDPTGSPVAAGKRAVLMLREDGWWLECVQGSGWMVNHEPVRGSCPLRSGDVVRLSQLGPEFRFVVLTGAETASSAGLSAARVRPRQPGGVPGERETGGLPSEEAVRRDRAAADDVSTTASAGGQQRLPVAVAVCAAAALVLVALIALLAHWSSRQPKVEHGLAKVGDKKISNKGI